MSLRWRWALSLGLVAALAIGVTAWAATLAAGRQLRGAVDADLRQRAVQVNAAPGALAVQETLQRRPRRTGIVDFDAVLQVFDRAGNAVLFIGPEGVVPPIADSDLAVLEGPGQPFIRDVRIGSARYRMITAPLRRASDDGGPQLAFQIMRDLSPVEDNLRGLAGRMVLIGAVGVLLVAVTGWFLASRAVRPVTDLTEAAEHIARTERLDGGGRLNRSAPGEIGRLAGAFAAMLSALSASRREQQRLVADAGHEFRTPITALKTNLETLDRQGERLSDRQRDELMKTAIEQSDQLASLANELVDLATDVQLSHEEFADVDLEELAREVAQRYRRVGGKQVVVSGEGAVVSGRRSQLERALSNLVDNAAKWAVTRVRIQLDGPTVTVVDDGPGIAEQDLPHIFRRFYRSPGARSTPGSGLGLAIVDHMVAAHGGTVFAGNSADGGAEVGFTIPR